MTAVVTALHHLHEAVELQISVAAGELDSYAELTRTNPMDAFSDYTGANSALRAVAELEVLQEVDRWLNVLDEGDDIVAQLLEAEVQTSAKAHFKITEGLTSHGAGHMTAARLRAQAEAWYRLWACHDHTGDCVVRERIEDVYRAGREAQ